MTWLRTRLVALAILALSAALGRLLTIVLLRIVLGRLIPIPRLLSRLVFLLLRIFRLLIVLPLFTVWLPLIFFLLLRV